MNCLDLTLFTKNAHLASSGAFRHYQECVASFLPMVNQAERNDAKKENNTLFGRKQHVVYEKTTRCLRENDTLFEGKRHVVWEKTTRCFKKNDTSVEVEGGIGEGKEDFKEMISDEEESKSGDFEDSSFSPKV